MGRKLLGAYSEFREGFCLREGEGFWRSLGKRCVCALYVAGFGGLADHIRHSGSIPPWKIEVRINGALPLDGYNPNGPKKGLEELSF